MARCPIDNVELTEVGTNALFLHCSAGPHDFSVTNSELSLITPSFVSKSNLAANTALTGVLVGTPVTPVAIASNSIVHSNIQADGDVVLAVNKGGTSHMAFHADGSTGDTIVQASTGQSVDAYIAGTKEIDYATGALAFQQATTVSTTTGNLTVDSAGVTELRDVVSLGTADQGITARTGQTLRASDAFTGGTGNIPGADLTISPGLGTGTGDVGQVIFSLPAEAGAGDIIQTRATRLTLDMTNSATVLSMVAAQATTFSTGAGDLTLDPTSDVVLGSGVALKAGKNNGAANTGVTAVEYGDGYNHLTVLTVSQVAALTLADTAAIADGYLLYTLPAGAVVIDYAYMSMSITAASTELKTDTPDVGLGTVMATGANALLDALGTYEDIITGQLATNANGTATVKTALPAGSVPFIIAAGADRTIHFNVADTWANDLGGNLTADIAGTVVIAWKFLA